MTIDEQRYLLNQDCLLMKYQRGNAMNEPLQIFRGKWADGLERLHQIIDKEVGWKNFRSFVSSNVHHDSETSIEVVKTHLNQCRIECILSLGNKKASFSFFNKLFNATFPSDKETMASASSG